MSSSLTRLVKFLREARVSLVLLVAVGAVLGGGEEGRLQWRHTWGGSGEEGVVGTGAFLGLLLLKEEEGLTTVWRAVRTLSANWELVLPMRPRLELARLVSMGSEQAQ
jgi:hypothetical protein